MAMSRELKVGIAGGVISSLFVIYMFQPIVDASIYIIKGIAILTGNAYYDRIFIQAAILEERNFSFLIVQFFMFLCAYTFAFTAYKIVRKSFSNSTKIKNKVEIKVSVKEKKSVSIMISIFVVIFIIFTGIVAAANNLQLELVTSFKQYMRIIRPYIDSSKEAVIISKWSQMKSRQDYQQVIFEIETIAKENGIILPENTLYSIDTL